MKALVVDPSATVRRIFANILRPCGFLEILEAQDGKSALEKCDASVRLVITEWNLGDIHGLDLVKQIRANADTSAVHILMVTARSRQDDVALAVEAGVNGFVVKPFRAETLKHKIEESLGDAPEQRAAA